MCSPWFELSIICGIVCFGQIVFAHFEERTPKSRKLRKLALMILLTAWISTQFGRTVFFSILGIMFLGVVVIHAWWLPSKGVNGWTGEPRNGIIDCEGGSIPPEPVL